MNQPHHPQGQVQPPAPAAPAAMAKLFREEAQTGSVQCPACGAPITLKGFGAIERVTCPYCGSESSPEENGALNLLVQASRQRRQSLLPLHARAVLDGIEWEIIGITWQECEGDDGVVYPWQEFLLFNPYHGYRYLIHSMSDGYWTLGDALAGAPQVRTGLGHRGVVFKGERYKHFQTSVGHVTYVEGEFPWQVHVGDQALAHEYIKPPRTITVEETAQAEGQDVNFTLARHIPAEAVWKAFGGQGAAPPTTGIGSAVPNPWHQQRWVTRLSFVVLLLLWLVLSVVYIGSRENKIVFASEPQVAGSPLQETIEVTGDRNTVLEIELRAPSLSNKYLYADILLIPRNSEDAITFGLQVDEWHGVTGGEAWREGKKNRSTVLGNIEPGTYTLEVNAESGGMSGLKDVPSQESYTLTIKQDVALFRYSFLAFMIIISFPFVFWLLGALFEARRWSNSDYASSSSD